MLNEGRTGADRWSERKPRRILEPLQMNALVPQPCRASLFESSAAPCLPLRAALPSGRTQRGAQQARDEMQVPSM